MSVPLDFYGLTGDSPPGLSLFTHAEKRGIPVPTSCNKQSKCRECVVEVTEDMRDLSKPQPEERHLKGNFRLSCCTRLVAEARVVRCHTMRRGNMRLEKHPFELPVAADLAHEDRLIAVRNIGTNIELIVGHKHKALAKDRGEQTTVIGAGPSEGLGGNGLVDLMSGLLRTGRMNQHSRFGVLSAALEQETVGLRSAEANMEINHDSLPAV